MLTDLDLGTDVTPEEGERKTDQNANIEDDLFLGAEGSIFTLDYVTEIVVISDQSSPVSSILQQNSLVLVLRPLEE